MTEELPAGMVMNMQSFMKLWGNYTELKVERDAYREALEAIQTIAESFKEHTAVSRRWEIADLKGMYGAIEKMCSKALGATTEKQSKEQT